MEAAEAAEAAVQAEAAAVLEAEAAGAQAITDVRI